MNSRSAGAARKRPVNLTLDRKLVDSARELTDNLSGVVESLLDDFVRKSREERESRAAVADLTTELWNRFDAKCGSFADEFSTL